MTLSFREVRRPKNISGRGPAYAPRKLTIRALCCTPNKVHSVSYCLSSLGSPFSVNVQPNWHWFPHTLCQSTKLSESENTQQTVFCVFRRCRRGISSSVLCRTPQSGLGGLSSSLRRAPCAVRISTSLFRASATCPPSSPPHFFLRCKHVPLFISPSSPRQALESLGDAPAAPAVLRVKHSLADITSLRA